MVLTGDWDKIPGFFNDMKKQIMLAGMEGNEDMAVLAKRIWRKGILTRSFNLQRLKLSTIKAKGSSTPLVDHKDFVNSINITETEGTHFVGINRMARKITDKGDIKIYNLAIIHEYGYPPKNIPPRSHRQKTLDAMKIHYVREMPKRIFGAVRRLGI